MSLFCLFVFPCCFQDFPLVFGFQYFNYDLPIFGSFVFILFGVCWTLSMCRLIFSYKFGKSSKIILWIFFLLLSLSPFFLVLPLHAFWCIYWCPTFLWDVQFSSHLFSLFFKCIISVNLQVCYFFLLPVQMYC